MISLIDLPPTLLRAGGLQPPEYMRGRPLQELLSNQARDWPDHVYAEISESHVGRLIRTVRWKYAIALTRAGEPHWHESFLYDLARDPHEQNNLAAEPMLLPIRQHLRKLLARQMIATGHLPPVFEPASCC
jgi:arylsulfatase A-like enzyme